MTKRLRFATPLAKDWLWFPLLLLWGVGCSSSSSQPASVAAGLPAPAAAGENNSYWGIQGSNAAWQISINHNTNAFTAADLSSPGGTIAGFFSI